ncbi:MAG: sigma-70 family RNA polymerase sigma factor [Sphingobacteriales bacterium]|nr:MAG: sigma-70 family RNA polymerase sigma factor [Sphingobacteriales bacterium]
MNQDQIIQTYQPMLQAIALKMLKCKADAEDLVQDTFVKWLSTDHEKVQNQKAYLIGAVTNTCINHINTLKRRKTEYFDNFHWPEFKNWFSAPDFSHLDIDAEVSAAFATLLNKLEPLERAVFLLKEIFNIDYEALQELLGKKQEHCRQLMSRARKKLQSESGKFSAAMSRKQELFSSFKNACNFGDAAELIALLKRDISIA